MNVIQKIALTSLIMMAFSTQAEEACSLTASQTTVNYGQLQAHDMASGSTRIDNKQKDWLATDEREVTFSIRCSQPKKMRLLFNAASNQSKLFAFGEQGGTTLTLRQARVDNRPVQMQHITSGEDHAGSDTLSINAEKNSVAFVNGAEISGKSADVTLVIRSGLSPAAFKTRDESTPESRISVTVSSEQ